MNHLPVDRAYDCDGCCPASPSSRPGPCIDCISEHRFILGSPHWLASASFSTTTSSVSPPTTMSDDRPLYTPQSPELSATFRFKDRVNSTFGLTLDSYSDLWRWSTNSIDDFWSLVWDFTGVVGHKGATVVDRNAYPSDNPAWSGRSLSWFLPSYLTYYPRFPDSRLNWAENLLTCRSTDRIALLEASSFYSFRSASFAACF